MSIPSRSPGGKPVTRALLAALQESAPGTDAPNLRRTGGAGAEEPTEVVFQWKKNQ